MSAKNYSPREIVSELDRHIIGQDAAKRAVAIALRNRWRRQQLDETLRDEVQPKNILMIGPTGCGKTEIARRLARSLLPLTNGVASFSYLKSAAVPMWAVYQFLVSVVLLRILIVMMTITYRRIYDDLDKQWK